MDSDIKAKAGLVYDAVRNLSLYDITSNISNDANIGYNSHYSKCLGTERTKPLHLCKIEKPGDKLDPENNNLFYMWMDQQKVWEVTAVEQTWSALEAAVLGHQPNCFTVLCCP